MSAEPPAGPPPSDMGPTTGYSPPLQQAPGAVASLVCGILGVTFVPLICSIAALILGYQSKRATAREPHRYSDALGQAGRILGWVGTLLGVLGLVAFIAAVAWFFAGFRDGSIDAGCWP